MARYEIYLIADGDCDRLNTDALLAETDAARTRRCR